MRISIHTPIHVTLTKDGAAKLTEVRGGDTQYKAGDVVNTTVRTFIEELGPYMDDFYVCDTIFETDMLNPLLPSDETYTEKALIADLRSEIAQRQATIPQVISAIVPKDRRLIGLVVPHEVASCLFAHHHC